MMELKTQLISGLVLFAFCTFTANAIMCFQCSSVEPGCMNLTSNDTNSVYYQECPINKTFCRKTAHTILDSNRLVRITRDCGWELYKRKEDNCYENDDDFKYEKSCQCFTDGCNAAHTAGVYSIVLTVSIASFLSLSFI